MVMALVIPMPVMVTAMAMVMAIAGTAQPVVGFGAASIITVASGFAVKRKSAETSANPKCEKPPIRLAAFNFF